MAAAEDRAVPGHGGDLGMGSATKSVIGMLVEKSRLVRLVHLPPGHAAEQVREALTGRMQEVPAALT